MICWERKLSGSHVTTLPTKFWCSVIFSTKKKSQPLPRPLAAVEGGSAPACQHWSAQLCNMTPALPPTDSAQKAGVERAYNTLFSSHVTTLPRPMLHHLHQVHQPIQMHQVNPMHQVLKVHEVLLRKHRAPIGAFSDCFSLQWIEKQPDNSVTWNLISSWVYSELKNTTR